MSFHSNTVFANHPAAVLNINCLPPYSYWRPTLSCQEREGKESELQKKKERRRRMVGVRAKRGISLVMITMVFLLKTISSSANTAAAALYNKSNNNDTVCCLIADDLDLESEFLMDSDIRRMLGAQISPGTLVKDKSSADCGRGKTYTSCLPPKNGVQRPDDHCDDPYNTHNRECRPQPT